MDVLAQHQRDLAPRADAHGTVRTVPISEYGKTLTCDSHLFIELCTGGDLFAWLSARKVFSEHEARYMAYQLMLGLSVMMSRDPSIYLA